MVKESSLISVHLAKPHRRAIASHVDRDGRGTISEGLENSEVRMCLSSKRNSAGGLEAREIAQETVAMSLRQSYVEFVGKRGCLYIVTNKHKKVCLINYQFIKYENCLGLTN